MTAATLRLRALEPADADLVLAIEEGEPALWECGDASVPCSRAMVERMIAHGIDLAGDRQARLVVEAGGSAAGLVDIFDYDPVNARAGLGIALLPAWRGRGLGGRAVAEAVAWCRRRWGIATLYAVCAADNRASAGAFARGGFRRVATLPAWLAGPRGRRDAFMMVSTTDNTFPR